VPSVIGVIVAVSTLGVCAGAAPADGVEDMTLADMVRWADEHTPIVMGVLGLLSVVILWRLRCLGPGGLNAGERDVKPIPAPMWIFCGIATLLGFYLGGQFGYEIVGPIEGDGTPRDQAIMTIMATGIGSLFGAGILWFVHRQAPESGTKPDWVDLPLGVGLIIVVYPLLALAGIAGHWIARGFDAVPQERIAHNTLQLISQNMGDEWNWVLIAAIVLLVPVVEELIYRVYFQSAFLRLVKSRWVAVFLTSAVFVIAHWNVLPPGGKHALAPLFALSVALGAAYERTGRLGVPVVMHAVFNATNILLAFVIDPIAE
jgi:membrane protease YdiL (CAAX protease family)